MPGRGAGYIRERVSTEDQNVVVPMASQPGSHLVNRRIVLARCDSWFNFDDHRCVAVDQEVGNVIVAVERFVSRLPADQVEETGPFRFQRGAEFYAPVG